MMEDYTTYLTLPWETHKQYGKKKYKLWEV